MVVTDHYGAILAVTDGLLASPRALTGAEVQALVVGAAPARPEWTPDPSRFWISRRTRWTADRAAA